MTMLPPPFRWQDEHIIIALAGAQVLFTTRRGGCSTGAYATLNLGRFTDDDPAVVEHNRRRVEQRTGGRLAYARQVHGTQVRAVSVPSPAYDPHPPEADGILTTEPGVAPMVLTADCLPIAIAGGGAVGVLHAGWRGLVDGIVARGVAALRHLSGPGVTVTAAIGPGAGLCCYEVSEDVHERFAAGGADIRQDRRLDLKAIARLQLRRAGVREVHDCELCTICSEVSLFFSHRRDAGLTGRQAGVAWLRTTDG